MTIMQQHHQPLLATSAAPIGLTLDRAARRASAAVIVAVAWTAALVLAVQALVAASSPLPLPVGLLGASALVATCSLAAARIALRLPVASHWLLLGLLPAVAGAYLLVGLR